MKFAHFFIDRPVFAAVLSRVIVIVGGISYFELPVAQYPDIALSADGDCDRRLSRRQRPDRGGYRFDADPRSRSTAWRTCSTCPATAPMTVRCTWW